MSRLPGQETSGTAQIGHQGPARSPIGPPTVTPDRRDGVDGVRKYARWSLGPPDVTRSTRGPAWRTKQHRNSPNWCDSGHSRASTIAIASADARAGSATGSGADVDWPNPSARARIAGSIGVPAWFAATTCLSSPETEPSIPRSPPRSSVETPAMNWFWRTSTRRSGSAARARRRSMSASEALTRRGRPAGRSGRGGGTRPHTPPGSRDRTAASR